MDDNSKHASSYQHDQEILDARGISMTVEEVAGLPTCKYSERVQSLNLKEDDLMFLKGLRRRIRNRLASQNSRRRSMENLRRLTRELRAVRACRNDALAERRILLATRTILRTRFGDLRTHILKVLEDRADPAIVPDLDPAVIVESPKTNIHPSLKTQIFECRIDKLVQQSVNHIYKEKDVKNDYKIEEDYKINNDYKTNNVHKSDKHINFIREDYKIKNDCKTGNENKIEKPINCIRDYKIKNDYKQENLNLKINIPTNNNKLGNDTSNYQKDRIQKLDKQEWKCKENDFGNEFNKVVCAKTVFIDGVLNLSKKKSHGRKQTAPRRIAYVFSEPDDDGVLDLKIKKEPQ